MVPAPRRGDDGPVRLAELKGELLVQYFTGGLDCVTGARDATAAFLADLARTRPPESTEAAEDVLLVANELTTNTIRFAPGPFTLMLRDTGEAIHVSITDTNTASPRPRHPDMSGQGGLGWQVISTLAEHTYVLPEPGGKSVHAILPW
ncbi:ATP-binding protein [Streptomyces jeddahensis]|nr:ATP-binding protein [Streptomyces jeddahensis]